MPKPPKGRSTPEQRSQYYGWHLILKNNLIHNKIPKESISVLNKLFYGQVKPTKRQYLNIVNSFSSHSKRPNLVVQTLITQLVKDTLTIKKYSKDAGFSQRTQRLFQIHCNEFIQRLKELKGHK